MMNDLRLADLSSHPALIEALRTTFGGAPLEGLEPLSGGMSGAMLAKLTIRGRRYALRITRPSELGGDARRELTCMRLAAERGLAPRVHYADEAHGLSIADYIEGPTLIGCLHAGLDRSASLGRLLRELHDGPPFPGSASVPLACQSFAAALAAQGAPVESERLSRIEQLREALSPHRTEAPCHHDLNPGNILVDGERLLLVDWQVACQGDPFHDLVTPGLFSPRLHEQLATMVRAYFGREPTELERARLSLTRTLALTLYGMIFSSVAIARGGPDDGSEPPSPLGSPGRFGEALEREAKERCASEEHQRAMAALGHAAER